MSPPDVFEPSVHRAPIVAIGVATGGFASLRALLEALPASPGMVLIVVPAAGHDWPAEDLASLSRPGVLRVVEAQDGTRLEPNTVYLARAGSRVTVRDHVLHTKLEGSGERQAIDKFFRSIASQQILPAIGILLSSEGIDGHAGLSAIRTAGGIAFADQHATEDEAADPALLGIERILMPHDMATELMALSTHPFMRGQALETEQVEEGGSARARIMEVLRAEHGVTSNRRMTDMLEHRVQRRMAICKLEELPEYAQLLESDRAEVDALYQDLLVRSTKFFREPEVIDALATQTFARLVTRAGRDRPLRVWVIECGTGADVYSLAIRLLEQAASLGRTVPMKIFGTDVSPSALAIGRAGTYSEVACADISTARLQRFFERVEGGYRIRQRVRDLCVFARHDIARDFPFSRIDLLSCRDVLPWFEQRLQRQILPKLHYALSPGGVFQIDAADDVTCQAELFDALDPAQGLYLKRPGSSTALQLPSARPAVRYPAHEDAQSRASEALQRRADVRVLSRYGPAGVVVDSSLSVIQFRGDTSPYLELVSGQATFHILRLCRTGVLTAVSDALDEATRTKAETERDGAGVTIRVFPLTEDGYLGGHLVLFEPAEKPQRRGLPLQRALGRLLHKIDERGAGPADRQTHELQRLRVQLHTVIDEYRVKAHELQAANEQVATINEALENANEELLGTNEELRATTEQLTSVNEQLEVRNDALVGANDDLRNLLTSVKIPILVVDRKRTIRLFTESAAELCELEDRDTGRPIGQIRSRIRVSDFDAMLTRVLEEFGVESCEGQDRTGHWHQVVIRPYKTADNQVNGAVISMTDIDAVKTTELRLRDARDYAQGIVETVREPLVVIDDHLTIVSANAAFYRLLQLDREDVERRTLWDVPATSWDAARLRATLERALADDVRVEDLQLDQTFPDVGTRNFLLNIRPIHRHGQSKLLLLAMEDVTDRRQAERLEARLVSGILRAQAGERERIAHELHDETGQALSALLVHLRTLEETIDASDARARVQRLRNDVRTCIENVRRLARGLHPATLADLGLLGAVKEIADAFTQTHGIPVHLTIEGEAALAGLAEEIALALFRVIQEALTNVARHAKAENVSLELGHDTVCVTILLHDDGIGFDSPGAKTGLGLVVMRRRIEELGGRLELRSVPGEGTSIQAQVPVPLQPGLQPISPR